MISLCKNYKAIFILSVFVLIFFNFNNIYPVNTNCNIEKSYDSKSNNYLIQSERIKFTSFKDQVFTKNKDNNLNSDFSNDPIIFIGGYARSGTTLMR